MITALKIDGLTTCVVAKTLIEGAIRIEPAEHEGITGKKAIGLSCEQDLAVVLNNSRSPGRNIHGIGDIRGSNRGCAVTAERRVQGP